MYKFYEDAGHGWLEVPMIELRKLKIDKKISSYSYKKGGMAYLEEDSDATKFWIAKILETKAKTKRIYHEESPIREYESYEN